jgi:hypothetical protein
MNSVRPLELSHLCGGVVVGFEIMDDVLLVTMVEMVTWNLLSNLHNWCNLFFLVCVENLNPKPLSKFGLNKGLDLKGVRFRV